MTSLTQECLKQGKKNLIIGSQSIVHFVDLVETNKKVYEGNFPRSLLGPVEAFKGTKIA